MATRVDTSVHKETLMDVNRHVEQKNLVNMVPVDCYLTGNTITITIIIISDSEQRLKNLTCKTQSSDVI